MTDTRGTTLSTTQQHAAVGDMRRYRERARQLINELAGDTRSHLAVLESEADKLVADDLDPDQAFERLEALADTLNALESGVTARRKDLVSNLINAAYSAGRRA